MKFSNPMSGETLFGLYYRVSRTTGSPCSGHLYHVPSIEYVDFLGTVRKIAPARLLRAASLTPLCNTKNRVGQEYLTRGYGRFCGKCERIRYNKATEGLTANAFIEPLDSIEAGAIKEWQERARKEAERMYRAR